MTKPFWRDEYAVVEMGYEVFKATEPEQAYALIQQHNIQVWLIDQHLNNQQLGLDFILQYRQDQVPVALITADSDPELPQRLKELNVMLLKSHLNRPDYGHGYLA